MRQRWQLGSGTCHRFPSARAHRCSRPDPLSNATSKSPHRLQPDSGKPKRSGSAAGPMSKTQRLCHALSLPLVPLRKLAPGLQAEHPTRWPGTSQRFRALSLSVSLYRFQPASGSVGAVLINQAARLPCGEESCVDVEHHLTECLITQYRDLNARVTVYLIDRTLTTASQ